MTNLLVIGNSSIFSRRVLPVLEDLDVCNCIDIASLSFFSDKTPSSAKLRNVYKSYSDSIKTSDAEWVYISTINSLHEQLAEESMQYGKNVIIDKPAALSEKGAYKLIKSAKNNKVKVVEASVFSFHPQFEVLKDIFTKQNLLRIVGGFSIPPLEKYNFRNHANLGGGVVYDMAAYILGLGRLFWQREPIEIIPSINVKSHGVIKSINILLDYGKGRTFLGTFGFDTHYFNKAIFLTNKTTVELERVFTITPEICNVVKITSNGKRFDKIIEGSDPFKNFFKEVLEDSIDFKILSSNLVSNAKGITSIMEKLK